MPREERRIIFDYAELYKAIFTLSVKKDAHPPPPGVISALKVKSGNEEMIVVKIVNSQKNSTSEHEYSRDFLAAALMTFCRSCRIPLPQKGKKSLEVTGGSIILHIVK